MAQLPENTNNTLHIIEQAVLQKAEDWKRHHLGASVIGNPCNRALWYGFRWCKAPALSGRQLRLFARGQREEDILVNLLRQAGVRVITVDVNTGQQYRFSDIGGHFGGSMDGAALGLVEAPKTWHVLEFKTHNAKSFVALIKNGVQASKPMHYTQMQCYMHWTGMKRAYYMAVNKNDDSLYGERIHYDDAHAEAALSKADSIIKANEPPAGISQNPEWYECKWCDYHDLCFGQRIALKSCRTCIHATPIQGGNTGLWSCALNQSIDAKQKKGCDQHLFIPVLIPFADPVDANEAENWIQYETQQGVCFRNCSQCDKGLAAYSSDELQHLPTGLIADAGIDQIRTRLNAEIVCGRCGNEKIFQ
ncbi:MAG: oxidoreductase [Proteobacteria bacterium]|nr:MAG: oxidoreductase [Pseudomonadota bacterium]